MKVYCYNCRKLSNAGVPEATYEHHNNYILSSLLLCGLNMDDPYRLQINARMPKFTQNVDY